MSSPASATTTGVEIAIVGMAGRFPGADDIDMFWRNVRNGVESVTELSDAALREQGVAPETMADPAYVRSGVMFDGMDQFDAGFFGFSPRDAERLDPQHRLFLEIAWCALEHAGYGNASRRALTGVYAGSGANLYLMRHLLPSLDWRASDIASLLGLLNGNDKDSLATRVAYKLDLRGPAISVQTACSTSLAAVHLACRGLLNHEADMALAGGVWLNLLQGGYRYQPGAILSPDGQCRAFDAAAAGTAVGSGAGIVVLKRLADAIADRDTIHAVIKGSALNNDGAAKVGYTAPSVDGQAEAILAAQAMAEIPADSIGYVEAHGTATTLGDPIEIAALTQAFRASTKRRGFCAIGSVKTNIGHLDAAAGVAGLIKAAMAIEQRTLPPSLNFRSPNPQIDFAGSPFFVNTEARDWPGTNVPRRAGVSSFGMGGTNVHLVLEEAPPLPGAEPRSEPEIDGPQLLMLSARTPAALDVSMARLAAHLADIPRQALSDVAHTLRVGRKRFEHRCAVLARNHDGAIRALQGRSADLFVRGRPSSARSTVAFLFPGQGAQHAGMGRDLYAREPLFRDPVDRCCEHLEPSLQRDLRELLFASTAGDAQADASLDRTAITQPALFVIEYAMAQWWMSLGVQPAAMVGHSIGEYVAACLAGVMSLQDALEIVSARGRLLQAIPAGAMLAVSLGEREIEACLDAGCDVAAVNAPDSCVLSGPISVIDNVERDLSKRGIHVRRLRVSHAFHSSMVEPMLEEFAALAARIGLSAPRIPFISNVSGRWITPEEACSPAYWVKHVRHTVRFVDGIGELLGNSEHLLLEVGPGETLSALARRHPLADTQRTILASQCHPQRREQNVDQPARCMAHLWIAGVELGMATLDGGARRVPLPTYPFERQSYWIQAPAHGTALAKRQPEADPSNIANWLYVPTWTRAGPLPLSPREAVPARGTALVLSEDSSLSAGLLQHLSASNRPVVRVERGPQFACLGDHHYAVRPENERDFEQLLRAVAAETGPVSTICHLWTLDSTQFVPPSDEVLERGFYSLLALARALNATSGERQVDIVVVTNHLEDVVGTELLCPAKATLHGPCKVIPQEYPNVTCRLIDVDLSPEEVNGERVSQIVAEMDAPVGEPVAYRGRHRWIKSYVPAVRAAAETQRLRKHGVYLVTGGLGGIGLILARHLARHWQAKLVLVARAPLPERRDWPALSKSLDQPESVRNRLASLLELESLGGEVAVLHADVADPVEMRAAVAATRQRFGALHGVVHAAGVPGGGLISSRSREAVAKVFAAKIRGTSNVLEALGDEPVDFVLLCSSLTAITGGFGQVDYCAANCFLDACAALASRRDDRFVLSVNWDVWLGVGMAAAQQRSEGSGIAAEQGGTLFEMLLSGPRIAQVLVSTLSVEQQIAEARSLVLAHRLPLMPADKKKRYARPELSIPYAEPTSELEQGLAAAWEDFLGIAPIGIDDSLFELGGDSLLALQLLARVRDLYGVELHPAALFKTPTIAALAELVETRLIEDIENDATFAAAPAAALVP